VAVSPAAEHPCRLTHPEWSRSAAIYQINTRQLTPEGTLAAAQEHLPRLRELGFSIIWLMPVHEIGSVNRKGELGSPYAVRDHYSVNPELGTLADLRAFVDAAHALGLRVILDWVANHTAWDHPLVTEHPEWYLRDDDGGFRPTPWYDWDDIIELDFRHAGLRDWMRDALVHWVREVGIDGYRCDVAGFVPTAFWEEARAAMEAIRPVFLLAEWEARDLHDRAFDASYAWSWYTTLERVAAGEGTAPLRDYYSTNDRSYPRDAYRMTFVSNHDKNAWDGTEHEVFGDALEAAVVLSVVGEGIPLVYNGQEAGNERRLPFFDRAPLDESRWDEEHPMGALYRDLLSLRAGNANLWNGAAGERMVEVRTDRGEAVFAFTRGRGEGSVLTVLNMTRQPAEVTLDVGARAGRYVSVRDGEQLEVGSTHTLRLPAWGHVLAVQV
jgi:glycosidase